MKGVYTGNTRGFGFVTVEGEPDDIYIPEGAAQNALHQDVVEVEITGRQSGRRREGRSSGCWSAASTRWWEPLSEIKRMGL